MKKGQVLKALALGSHLKCVEPFQKVLVLALADYINATLAGTEISLMKGKEIIESLYYNFSCLKIE